MNRALLLSPFLLLLLLSSTAWVRGSGGYSPVDTFSDGRGASCERGNASFCPPAGTPTLSPGAARPNVAQVPGPPLLAGLLAFYARARSIRSRILASQGNES
jgi:hypothetical protein